MQRRILRYCALSGPWSIRQTLILNKHSPRSALLATISGVYMASQHNHHHHHHPRQDVGHPLHEHHHDHAHDFVAANKEHFDKTAGEYEDIPMLKDLTEKYVYLRVLVNYWDERFFRQGKFIVQSGYKFNPESTTLLNFACGTGTRLFESERVEIT